MKLHYLLIILITILSCSTVEKTPEQIIEEYVIHLSKCEFDEASEMSTTRGKLFVDEWKVYGCEGYETKVDSVICKTGIREPDLNNDSLLFCTCYETRISGSMAFDYYLIKVEGEWKAEWPGKHFQWDDTIWKN